MRILGIHNALDSGAALIEDGRILAAINEERLNRKKLTRGFPVLSIKKILEIRKDIDLIAIDCKKGHSVRIDKPFKSPLDEPDSKISRFVNKLIYKISPILGISNFSWQMIHALRLIISPMKKKQEVGFLRKKLGLKAPIYYFDHHYNHACSAYYTSGFLDAVVITMDGGGEGYSSKIYEVREGNFKLIAKTNTYDSLGNFYAYITALLGFKAHKHEGKITGLAALGKPVYLDLFRKMITHKNGKIRNLSNSFMFSTLDKIRKTLPVNYKREDVAASIQELLEEIAGKYCEYWIKKIGIGDVALAGGVFANVRLNQKIHELDCVDNIFIHPGMGDGGLALGAAFAAHQKFCKHQPNSKLKIEDVYFGPEYSNEGIEKELKRHGLKYQYIEIIEKEIAKLLAKGHVVARFNGRMEYGPRALGNRSILCQATDPTVNDWLNKKLVRTEFMPFAPVTLKEFAHETYKNVKGAEHTAKFMTITFDCSDDIREKCPAVVHVDGTARPQIIDKETNPSYYKILEEYYKITKLSSIINTSFNMHEEPIVCSPDDAIRSFKKGHLDYLAIGNFLVEGIR